MTPRWAALVLVTGGLSTVAAAQDFPIIVNECGSGRSGFVELLNRGDEAIDLAGDPATCWFVDDADGGGAAKRVSDSVVAHATNSTTCAQFGRGPRCGILAPGERGVVSYGSINAVTRDGCRLVSAPRTASGCSRAHTDAIAGGETGGGKCFGRNPDGDAWSTAEQRCTPGGPNDACATSGVCVVPGSGSGLVLRGTIVTPDRTFKGEVLVQGDEIACVDESCELVAAQATRVETDGIILPGLIDTHNHILFDIFDETDWSPEPTDRFLHHDQWPTRARYKALVDAKQTLNGEEGSSIDLGCEMLKYGELKALIAGTTSVVGAATPANRLCYGSLARTIDQRPNGLPEDRVQAATLFPRGNAGADTICRNLANGNTAAFLIHLGEGLPDSLAHREFDRLLALGTSPGCLLSNATTVVHGTALGDAQFEIMAARGMGLVWSPRSNVFLYGQGTDLSKTTDIPAALARGIKVAIAPDWSIGGSQNLLDELRFANQVDDSLWSDVITSEQLVQMVTSHPAELLGLGNRLGRLSAGLKADITVIAGDRTQPYAAVLGATPRSVRLVLVGGEVLYGDPTLRSLARAPQTCESLDLCGDDKFVCVARPDGTPANKLGQSYQEIRDNLEQGVRDYDALDRSAWNFAPIAELYRCPEPDPTTDVRASVER